MKHALEIIEVWFVILFSHEVSTLIEFVFFTKKLTIIFLLKLLLNEFLHLVLVAWFHDVLFSVVQDRLSQVLVQVMSEREVLDMSLLVEMLHIDLFHTIH